MEKFHYFTFERMELDISGYGSLGTVFGKSLLFGDLKRFKWYIQIWVREISRQRKG